MMVNAVNGVYKNLPTSSGVKRGRNKNYATGTYIKLVACVIQDSPNRMLPFKQIMKKLEPSVFGDRKSIENNIRVCLSANSCFTKVPVDPQYPNATKNYWKVDESGITQKMLRRHFNGIIDMFPELSHRTLQRDKCGNAVVLQPIQPICNVPTNKSEVKFTGPFSIASILRPQSDAKHVFEGPFTISRRRTLCYDQSKTRQWL
ncbi:forkhead box protein H1 [Triplophysa rosa]|uniref:Fork-head domain-containing protein n=1 Tax=Triplophysa rosa TaxID=992332 RepID=A0A9W7TKX9_TRIRA|nr:forkhead box protein H1 [Triplophysa rosa]KAI7798581.1 hypothetical protein IRJ41_007951 [Triplophysa rosa]